MYINSINGFYHTQSLNISEECLGSWMIPKIENISLTVKNTIEDPSSL